MNAGGLAVAAALVLVSGVAVAAEEEPLEIDILEEYLATHDRTPGTPHCARHHGHVMTPQGPVRTEGTNRLLEEHVAFHVQQRDQPPFRASPDDADRYGIVFLEWHRQLLGTYDAWRLANGYPPLPAWDPSTPMPPNLAYPYPERSCTDGRNEDPQLPLPTWATVAGGEEADPIFGFTSLCQFRDLNQFGKSIAAEYHWEFHARLGGEMRVQAGPRDPAFWSGHQFINSLMDVWWESCEGAAVADVPGDVDVPRLLPGPGVALALAGVGAAVALVSARRGSGE